MMLGNDEFVDVMPDQIIGFVAEDRRPGRIDLPEYAVEPDRHQQIGGRFPKPVAFGRAHRHVDRQLFVAGLKLGFQPLPLGHVGGRTEPFGDLAIVVEQRRGAGKRPADGAIGAIDAMFQVEQRFRHQRVADSCRHLRPFVCGDIFRQPVRVGGPRVGKERAARQLAHLTPIRAHRIEYL